MARLRCRQILPEPMKLAAYLFPVRGNRGLPWRDHRSKLVLPAPLAAATRTMTVTVAEPGDPTVLAFGPLGPQ